VSHQQCRWCSGSASPIGRYLGSLHASGSSTVWRQTVKLDYFRVADQPSFGWPSIASSSHIQRGGTPSAFDRVLASRYGIGAIDQVHKAEFGVMVALRGTDIVTIPLVDATARSIRNWWKSRWD